MKSTANSFAVPAQAGTRFQMNIGALVAPLDSGVRQNDEATLPIGRFRKAVAWLTLISFLGQTTVSVAGGIVADPSAPASQRPTVLNAANGVPQVNIQTPSVAGVSRNTYSQFDVQQQGAILNNARTNTQTQLGGWIQGNPSLAAGTARIILNEVNSSNPSMLQGYVEVAGDRAQVVIANPAGVACDGCGFINANRATLTTGTPIMNGGSLDGYLVQRGQVTVQGMGLDAGQSDYTDIIARSVQVNAGIWANDLKVTAGANRINTDHTQITPIAGSGDAPAFAVDVAQLGGMYAGKIHLIGTEAGVGVRNAGNIGASAGEVVVTVDGRLENAGTLTAATKVGISASSITNSGTIYTQGDATLTISGAIDNTAGRIEAAQDIALVGDGLTNTGGVVNGRNVSLDSQAQALDNTRGTLAAQGTLTIRSGRLTNDAGLIQAVDTASIDTHGQALDNTNSGSAGGIVGQRTVTLTTGDLNNRSGFIGAEGNLVANGAAITNTQGGILIGESALVLIGTSLDNRGGQVQSLGGLTVDTGSGAVDNTASLLRSGSTLAITAGSVVNASTQGADQGIEGQYVVIAASEINNQSGAIRADDTLALTGHGTLDNTLGLISSSNTVSIADSNLAAKAQTITNTGGTIIAGTNLQIDSASLTGDGKVLSQGDLSAKLTSNYTHTGEFQANGDVTLETTGTVTNQAKLTAGATLNLTAATIDNQVAGEIIANKLNLTATDSHTLINRGLIDGQDTFIDTITLNNLGTGRIYGDHIAIAATTLNNDAETVNGVTRAAVIAARDRLDIGATTIANRDGALLFSAGDMAIAGALDADHQAAGQADMLTNRNATIEALGSVSITAASIQNLNAGVTVTQETGSPVGYDQFTPRGTSVVLNSADYPGAQIGNFNMSSRSAGPYSFREYWRYVYSGTTTRDTVSSSLPGNIFSGSDMTLIGNVTNSDSKIIAGGALDIIGGSLQNTNTEGHAVTSYSGTQYYYDYDGNESCGDPGDGCYDISASAYNPANSVSTFSLPTTRVEQQTAPTGSGTVIAALATSSVTQTASGTSTVIRTVTPNTVLPTNSLFSASPNPTANYLVETDPRFAGYRNWLSSDYMLQQMNADPALAQKRIGDGFYEQKLVREQVAQLTGRRFLEGYSNDEAQYQALMNAGVTVAQAWNLTPGVALSDAQVAQLTSDIVWLVEKDITQADGSTANVLVPQVYVRLQEGDLDSDGALLAGDTLNLTLAGDLGNAGTIHGRTVVSLAVDNIKNLGGRIAGRDVSLTARTDLANLGGTLQGGDRLSLSAGRDLTVASTTQSSANRAGLGSFSRTNLDRVAGLYVTNANGTLIADAGRDLTLTAAAIVNDGSQGQTLLAAGRDLTLDTVTRAEQNNSVRNAKNYQKRTTTADLGTTIQTRGDLTLVAGNDLRAKASSVTSEQGTLTAIAGHDLTLTAGRQTSAVEQARHTQQSGTFSSKRTTTRDSYDDDTAIGSTFSGDAVNLQAGNDLAVQGSNVVATRDVNLAAGNDISIEAAEQTHDETHARKTSKSGVFSSGVGFTVGSQKLQTTNDTQQVTNLASTVGSLEGDVSIDAGKAFTQTGSNVLALNGDIDIAAQQVDINTATDSYANQQTTKFKQSGLSVGLSGGIISAVQNTIQEAKAVANLGDSRVRQLATAVMALDDASSIKSNVIGMQQGYDKGGLAGAAKSSGISLNVSLGTSMSSSSTSQTATQAVASEVIAGGDINITATGAGKESDLSIQGSSIKAGRDVTLKAEDTINLLAAQNTAEQHSKNKSSSASIGVSVGISADGVGVGINASASQARGKADGRDVVYSNTQVDAANKLTLESDGDTTLKGAVAEGKQVVATIGGNLSLASLQDTSTYKSKQQSVGVGISVPIIGVGVAGGSISASQAKAKGDYASVVEQTGIRAGDEGFSITTQGNTDLKGAIIASTEKAVQDNKNSLTTGTFTYSDILNHTEASASSNGINLTQDLFSKYGAARTALSTAYQNIGENEHRSSVTQSAIEQGAINITAQNPIAKNISEDNAMTISRDTQNANQPVIKLDATALEQQVAKEAQLRAADVALVTRVTDDAYRVMFREAPKFYKATCPAEKDCVANPKLVQVEPVTGTPEEIQVQITQNGDANAVLAVNGIQNGIERGVELAFQNAAMVKTDANGQPLPNGGQDKPQTIYLMHYQPANSTVSELIVAGYEKLLTQVDSDTANFLGYTNPDMTYAQTLQGFGNNAVNSLGHSRGTEVQLNAFNILGQQGYANDSLTVRGVGGAVSAQQYTDAAISAGAMGRNVIFNYYSNDPVSTLAGGNPGNSGVMALRDLWTVLTGGDNTQHSCYGTGAQGCSQVEIPTATGPQGTNGNLIQYQGGQRIDNNQVGRSQ